MERQFRAIYRTLLKQMYHAARVRPHYLQDIRFLLARPLVDSTASSVTDGTVAPGYAAPRHATWPPVKAASTEDVDAVSSYLTRPPCECVRVNGDTLFTLCRNDLRAAIEAPVDVAGPQDARRGEEKKGQPSGGGGGGGVAQPTPGLSPVAIQMLRYRELLWLKERLDRVLAEATRRQLAEALDVAAGPNATDFIPDDFFDKGGVTATRRGLLPGGSQSREAREQLRHDALYSAGALGLRHEMFVLRHTEACPMARHFLGAFGTLGPQQLETAAHSHDALQRLVTEHVPKEVTCWNDDEVQLTVEVRPFDARYTSQEHRGAGYFATAHRQLLVHFSLRPVRSGMYVQVVNSYFARFDVQAGELTEEVGLLHSRDVRQLLRQRDLPSCHANDKVERGDESSSGSDNTCDTTADVAKAVVSELGTDKPATASASDAVATEVAGMIDGEHGRDFDLAFIARGEGPEVMKGILYYKVGGTVSDLPQEPIRLIPFGLLLLYP